MKNWKEFQRVKDEFFIYLANNLFLRNDVDFDVYTHDYTPIIGGYPLFERTEFGASKILYLDVDGTLTASPPEEGLSINYYRGLSEINPRVRKYFHKVEDIFKNITKYTRLPAPLFKKLSPIFEKSKIIRKIKDTERRYGPLLKKEVSKLSDLFRRCKVKKEESNEAVKVAIERTPLVTNIFPALAELEEMGFELGIASSGPSPVIKELARELQILEVKSSTFHFNKGEFTNIDGYTGLYKKLDEEKSYDACVFVSDNPEADYRIASTFDLGLIVWITDKEKEKLPGKIFVKLSEIREDFMKLPYFVRKYEWARLYSWYISPRTTQELCETIKLVNHNANLCRNTENVKEVFYYGKKVEEEVKNFLQKSKPVFADYDTRKLLHELHLVEDIERYKNLIADITNRVNESPLAKADENFIQGIAQYIKEELGGWEYG